MTILPDATTPREPMELLRHLLETVGLHTTLEALGEACGWRGHYFRSHGGLDTAARLDRAAQAIDFIAYTHCRGLNDWRAE
jgi:hypothetical protein